MAIVKVVELLAQSNSSWEDAAREALKEARKTIRNIQSIYVSEFQAVVGDNQEIQAFRVNCKISFVIDEERR